MTSFSDWNKFPKNWTELSQVLQKIGKSIGIHTHLKADVTDFAHHTTHESGGGDSIKLDDLAAPDANTDLNATTTKHGLLLKATAPNVANRRHFVALDYGETGYENKSLFDETNAEALGTAAPGTSLFSSRRDHVHSSLINASSVIIPNGVGSPSYDDLQDLLRMTHSAGRLTGGVISAHTPANGTVDITELEGMIFKTNSLGGDYVYFKKTAGSVTPTDGSVSWVYYDYNGGTPQFATTTSRDSIHQYDQFVIGRCWRSGNTVEVEVTGMNLWNRARRDQDRLIEKFGNMDQASGGVLTASATGTRTIAVSAGHFHTGNSSITTADVDTGTGSVMNLFWRSGASTWTEVSGETQIPNSQYNRLSDNSLQNLTSNRFGVYWLFICPEGRVYAVYGQGDYTSAQAIEAKVPSSLPPYCVNWAKLIGKIIIQQGASVFTSVESAFSNVFTQTAATWHPDLGGRSEAAQHPIGALDYGVAPAAGLQTIAALRNGETSPVARAMFDDTNPEATGVAAPGTSLIASRRDHVHAAPAATGIAVPESFAWFVS
jgi:hypothetical protein